jgi:hypothetical protein
LSQGYLVTGNDDYAEYYTLLLSAWKVVTAELRTCTLMFILMLATYLGCASRKVIYLRHLRKSFGVSRKSRRPDADTENRDTSVIIAPRTRWQGVLQIPRIRRPSR